MCPAVAQAQLPGAVLDLRQHPVDHSLHEGPHELHILDALDTRLGLLPEGAKTLSRLRPPISDAHVSRSSRTQSSSEEDVTRLPSCEATPEYSPSWPSRKQVLHVEARWRGLPTIARTQARLYSPSKAPPLRHGCSCGGDLAPYPFKPSTLQLYPLGNYFLFIKPKGILHILFSY